MFTFFVLLGILFLVITCIKRIIHNFEIDKCSGCKGNCRSCNEGGLSLVERYHQGELHQ